MKLLRQGRLGRDFKGDQEARGGSLGRSANPEYAHRRSAELLVYGRSVVRPLAAPSTRAARATHRPGTDYVPAAGHQLGLDVLVLVRSQRPDLPRELDTAF